MRRRTRMTKPKDGRTVTDKTMAELQAEAEIAWRNVLIAWSQAQNGNCCGTPEWRGHLCEYHRGYSDGIDCILGRIHAVEEMMTDEPPRDG